MRRVAGMLSCAMRLTALVLVACICGAAPALGAPICQNRLGDFVHCEAKEAMPLGWHVPDDVYTARVLSRTPPARSSDLVAAGMVLACLFALIALLPKFDGAKDEDWQDK
jgi:hypothetical protein